jgi:TetR/AcrR family transcriptional repressor of nem operon
VLAEAGRLFRERGFDGIGVAELMQAAGFTHGGFYNHFASKNELAAEVSRDILTKSVANLDRKISGTPAEKEKAFAAYIASYLSVATRDAPGKSCPIAALGPEVARQDKEVKAAFAEGLELYLASLVHAMPPRRGPRGKKSAATRADAIVLLANLIGGVVLARATSGTNEALSLEILEIVRAAVLSEGETGPA